MDSTSQHDILLQS